MSLFSDSDSPSGFMFHAHIPSLFFPLCVPLLYPLAIARLISHSIRWPIFISPIRPSLASILYTRPYPLRHSPPSSLCPSFQLCPFSDRPFSSSTPPTRDQTQGLRIAIGIPLYCSLLCLFLSSTKRRNKRQGKTFLSIPGQPPFGLPNVE